MNRIAIAAALLALTGAAHAESGMFLCLSPLLAHDYWTDLANAANSAFPMNWDTMGILARKNRCQLVPRRRSSPDWRGLGRHDRHHRRARARLGGSGAVQPLFEAKSRLIPYEATASHPPSWPSFEAAFHCADRIECGAPVFGSLACYRAPQPSAPLPRC